MPTANQTIMFVALPNGLVESRMGATKKAATTKELRLSVFVSPRLVTDASQPTLDHFPHFLDWTRLVQGMKFSVQFRGLKDSVPATFNPKSLDPRLWPALFKSPVAVKSYKFTGHHQQSIFTNQTTALFERVRDFYQDVAIATLPQPPHFRVDLPSARHLIGLKDTQTRQPPIDNHLGGLVLSKRVLSANVLPGENPLAPVLTIFKEALKNPELADQEGVRPLMQSPLKEFLHLLVFHAPRIPHKVDAPRPIIREPAPDFHAMLSYLSEYPVLLRLLGLVIDLTVPLDGVRAEGTVNVLAPDLPPAPASSGADIKTRIVTPLTFYTLTDQDFRAPHHPDSDSALGMLRFDDPNLFQPIQVDVDGAALKLFYLANNLNRALNGQGSTDTPKETGAPALRTGGISVVRKTRAEAFHARMVDANSLNDKLELAQPNDPTGGLLFSADDLIRGYRVDVREISRGMKSPWRSLCLRRGSYSFTTKTGERLELPVPFVLDESTVTTAPTSDQAQRPVAGQPPPPPPDLFLQESLFRWDGWSLAVRRPGLALPVDEHPVQVNHDDDTPPMEPLDPGKKTYGMDVRFDIEPGSLPRLRFGRNYQLRARTVDLAGNSRAFDDNSLPARKAVTPIFTYRRFEPAAAPLVVLGSKVTDGESLERVIVRSFSPESAESKQLSSVSIRHILPPRVSQQMAELHGMFDDLTTDKAYDLIAARDLEVKNESELPIHSGPNSFPVNYLPDPLAKFVRLNFYQDNNLIQSLVRPCYTTGHQWPDASSFALILFPSAANTSVSILAPPGANVVEVRVPPAETLRVEISVALTPEDLEQLMGVYHWVQQKAETKKDDVFVSHFRELYQQFGAWLLSPARELLLVNAVQQPRAEPKITKLSVQRDPVGQTTSAVGQTKATLEGRIELDGKSTIKADLLAQWDEYTGTGPTPDKPTIGRAHVCELPVEEVHWNSVEFSGKVQEFGDTKHRIVRYTVEAATRFRENFINQIEKAKSLGTKFPLSVTSPDPGAAAVPVARLNVLSTTRPAAPKVQYVVPTFGWQRQLFGGGAVVASVRRGSGLRVYLDGPWYSSGEGEQLAAVLPKNSPSPELVPFVTQWGRDPIRDTPLPPQQIAKENFPWRAGSREGMLLEELSTAVSNTVIAVGHKVGFDSGGTAAGVGARWYCDMAIGAAGIAKSALGLQLTDVPSYFPFIQLALARYQPDSIQGVNLSRVLRTDFIQLAPDRIAVFIFSNKAPFVIDNTTGTATLTIGAQKVDIKLDANNLPAIEEALGKPWVAGAPPAKKFVGIYVVGRAPFHKLHSEAMVETNAMAVGLQRAALARKSELDWLPVPVLNKDFNLLIPWKTPFETKPGVGKPEVVQWLGQIPLPADVATGNYRILLTESEMMLADVIDNASGLIKKANDALPTTRMVYVDTLEL